MPQRLSHLPKGVGPAGFDSLEMGTPGARLGAHYIRPDGNAEQYRKEHHSEQAFQDLPAGRDRQHFQARRCAAGVRGDAPVTYVRDAVNVDIDEGRVSMRAGLRPVCNTPYTDLWRSSARRFVWTPGW